MTLLQQLQKHIPCHRACMYASYCSKKHQREECGAKYGDSRSTKEVFADAVIEWLDTSVSGASSECAGYDEWWKKLEEIQTAKQWLKENCK